MGLNHGPISIPRLVFEAYLRIESRLFIRKPLREPTIATPSSTRQNPARKIHQRQPISPFLRFPDNADTFRHRGIDNDIFQFRSRAAAEMIQHLPVTVGCERVIVNVVTAIDSADM